MWTSFFCLHLSAVMAGLVLATPAQPIGFARERPGLQRKSAFVAVPSEIACDFAWDGRDKPVHDGQIDSFVVPRCLKKLPRLQSPSGQPPLPRYPRAEPEIHAPPRHRVAEQVALSQAASGCGGEPGLGVGLD